MPTSPSLVSMGQLLTALSAQVVTQQEILDEDYQDRLQAFALLQQMAEEQGYGALVSEMLPAATVIQQAEMEVQVRLAKSKEQEFALGVGLGMLNLGFQRRYSHSEYAQSTLQLTVQRVPLPPKEER